MNLAEVGPLVGIHNLRLVALISQPLFQSQLFHC